MKFRTENNIKEYGGICFLPSFDYTWRHNQIMMGWLTHSVIISWGNQEDWLI